MDTFISHHLSTTCRLINQDQDNTSLSTDDIENLLKQSKRYQFLQQFHLWWAFKSACLRHQRRKIFDSKPGCNLDVKLASTSQNNAHIPEENQTPDTKGISLMPVSITSTRTAFNTSTKPPDQQDSEWSLSTFLRKTGSVHNTFIHLNQSDLIFEKNPLNYLSRNAVQSHDGLFVTDHEMKHYPQLRHDSSIGYCHERQKEGFNVTRALSDSYSLQKKSDLDYASHILSKIDHLSNDSLDTNDCHQRAINCIYYQDSNRLNNALPYGSTYMYEKQTSGYAAPVVQNDTIQQLGEFAFSNVTQNPLQNEPTNSTLLICAAEKDGPYNHVVSVPAGYCEPTQEFQPKVDQHHVEENNQQAETQALEAASHEKLEMNASQVMSVHATSSPNVGAQSCDKSGSSSNVLRPSDQIDQNSQGIPFDQGVTGLRSSAQPTSPKPGDNHKSNAMSFVEEQPGWEQKFAWCSSSHQYVHTDVTTSNLRSNSSHLGTTQSSLSADTPKNADSNPSSVSQASLKMEPLSSTKTSSSDTLKNDVILIPTTNPAPIDFRVASTLPRAMRPSYHHNKYYEAPEPYDLTNHPLKPMRRDKYRQDMNRPKQRYPYQEYSHHSAARVRRSLTMNSYHNNKSKRFYNPLKELRDLDNPPQNYSIDKNLCQYSNHPLIPSEHNRPRYQNSAARKNFGHNSMNSWNYGAPSLVETKNVSVITNNGPSHQQKLDHSRQNQRSFRYRSRR